MGKRLRLLKVELNRDLDNNKYKAVIQLTFGPRIIISKYETDLTESAFRVVALATLSAINKALQEMSGFTMDFDLKAAEELHPPFLDKSLFIVMIEIRGAKRPISLTGAVVSEDDDYCRAICAATLDATNRFIQQWLF